MLLHVLLLLSFIIDFISHWLCLLIFWMCKRLQVNDFQKNSVFTVITVLISLNLASDICPLYNNK